LKVKFWFYKVKIYQNSGFQAKNCIYFDLKGQNLVFRGRKFGLKGQNESNL